MRCFICGSDTKVIRSRNVFSGYGVSRQRQCITNSSHVFATVESQPRMGLDRVAVRKSGSSELSDRPFDSERLFQDLRSGVLKRLSESAVREVCDDSIATIERNLGQLMRPLRPGESETHPEALGAILDTDIAKVIEDNLETTNRMALVLYALSIRGRRDRSGREGWKDARDVLDWLLPRFVHLQLPDISRSVPIPVESWFPATRAQNPLTLIKRRREDRLDGSDRRRDFDYGQFIRSIEQAMLGRRNASAKTEYVAQWVLWGIQGQEVVQSSQLAVGVLDCLRRVDDIAYLRWSAIAKGTDSVTEFAAEAAGLILHPSVRLKFRTKGRPPRALGAEAST